MLPIIVRTKLIIFFLCLFYLVFGSDLAHAGSPFYLTVERTYSDTEKPQFRLDYTGSSAREAPMIIRILKPNNPETFLDGQFNISRSYEEPQTALNPGHYLLRGLNSVSSPLYDIRSFFSLSFRSELRKDAFEHALSAPLESSLVSVPSELIHNPPRGFSTLQEFYLDLAFGGTSKKDLGWWLADSTWDEYSYRQRLVELEPLPDGLYLIQAVQGDTEAQSILQVSSISVQVKQSSEQLLIRAIDRHGNPVPNAQVSYRDGRGKWISIPVPTNEFGEIREDSKSGPLDSKLIVRLQTDGKREVYTSTDFLPVSQPSNSVYILTDRPIFKPGEAFFFKGAIRKSNRGDVVIPEMKSKEANISVFRVNGEKSELQDAVSISDFGTFDGKFNLDQTADPGLYKLVAQIADKEYAGEFRVKDYVKPSFYLTIIERSPVIIPGQKFDLHIRAKRYSGLIPQGVKYEVSIYRKRFEVAPFVLDSNSGLQAGEDYYGQIRSASAISQPERVFSSIENRIATNQMNNGEDPWDTAYTLDSNGDGKINIDIPKLPNDPQKDEWTYTIVVKAMDASKSQAVLSENVLMTLSEVVTKTTFNQLVGEVNSPGLKAYIQSTFPDGTTAQHCSGNLTIETIKPATNPTKLLQTAFTTDDKGEAVIDLPPIEFPCKVRAQAEIIARADRQLQRTSISEQSEMIIGGTKGEAILDNEEPELFPLNTVLSPGETTKVLALLPKSWGVNNWGTLWETIAGERIYATKNWVAKGRSFWLEVEAKSEYGTGFYHTLTVPSPTGGYQEKTISFRIIPWQKKLHISIKTAKEYAEPNKPFPLRFSVKDASGHPAPETELAVTIVDRAVYAVQPEFRPDIFHFFYPLPRLNLASFYSDNLQGYGYADLLRKPNFSLSALKTESKPSKRTMRDTAGWFPHLITDEKGEAEVVVDLPSNLTQWVVTVVAFDKNGKIGEANDRFQTRVDLDTSVNLPSFMRSGDKARGYLRVHNDTDKNISTKCELSTDAGLRIVKPDLKLAVEVPAKKEELVPLEIEAQTDTGNQGLNLTVSSMPEVATSGPQSFDIDLKSDSFSRRITGTRHDSNLIDFAIPPNSKIKELSLHVISGITGAALGALPALISYPYGCTEQLAHSTLPNLVILDVLKKAEITDANLGPLQQIAIKAQKNAHQGISKLLSNMKSDGGFSLWPSESQSACSPTLIALSAFNYASELGIEEATVAKEKTQSWIERNVTNCNFDSTSSLGINNLEHVVDSQIYSLPVEVPFDFVRGLLSSNQSQRLDELLSAYNILVYYETIPWHGFNQALSSFAKVQNIDPKNVILNKMVEQALLFDPKKYLESVRNDFSDLGFVFGPAQIEARVLEILVETNRLTPQLNEKLEGFLLSQYENGMWLSTYDTAQVIYSMRNLIAKEATNWKSNLSHNQLSVYGRDGQVLASLKSIPGGYYYSSKPNVSAESLLSLRIEGMPTLSLLYGYAHIEQQSQGSIASSSGIRITRTLLKTIAQGSRPLGPNEDLSVGDILVSELLISREAQNTQDRIASDFIVIEDPTPSLAESQEDELSALADAKLTAEGATSFTQVMDTIRNSDKVTRIVRLKSPGVLRVYQIWRVNFSGKASLPPALAYDMYDQRLNGNSAISEISVK